MYRCLFSLSTVWLQPSSGFSPTLYCKSFRMKVLSVQNQRGYFYLLIFFVVPKLNDYISYRVVKEENS